MATYYKGFRATDPIARLFGEHQYEVFFCYYVDNVKKAFRYKRGINSAPIKDRKKIATYTAAVFLEALNQGWNPSVDKLPKFDRVYQKIMSFSDALDFALNIKRAILSKYSMYDYSGAVKFIKAAARKTGHLLLDVKLITRMDIKTILSEGSTIYKWSAKSRNKHLERLKSLLSVVEDEELIPFNPCKKIKDLPEPKTLGYKRVTDAEKEQIASHLINHIDFFEYLMFIYHLGIRRTELLKIRIRNIDLVRREINIKADDAKTNTERVVPLNDDLIQILLRREIRSHNVNYYLFSHDFKPGENPIHPNTATNWWRKLVIKDLGIDCKMYSLKHKGGDDKIKAGIPLEALKKLYGHKSLLMTEIYAREVKQKYSEMIIAMSPAFSKVKTIQANN